jgi:hypothetical protein
MCKDEMNGNGEALPKPITLTPEQVQQVAAGTAAVLPEASGGATTGYCPPPEAKHGLA